MTSTLKVDTIQDIDGNNIINESSDTITIGASGDTITIPSGATLDVTSATVSGITSYANSDALTLFNAGGSAPVFACRAFVNFDGTGVVAIRASGNVSSITDNGTSDYTVNFTTAMSDTNYSVGGVSMRNNNTIGSGNSPGLVMIHGNTTYTNAFATSSVRINAKNANLNDEDPLAVCVQIFR